MAVTFPLQHPAAAQPQQIACSNKRKTSQMKIARSQFTRATALLCLYAFATTAPAQEVEPATAAPVTATETTNSQSQTESATTPRGLLAQGPWSVAVMKQKDATTTSSTASTDHSTTAKVQKFTFARSRRH